MTSLILKGYIKVEAFMERWKYFSSQIGYTKNFVNGDLNVTKFVL